MTKTRWSGRALSAALLAGSMGACDFITATDRNPNAVPAATIDQLFTATQVNSYLIAEDQVNRIAAIWIQQAAGTDRQFSGIDTYVIDETTADSEFGALYAGGGLVDLRLAQGLATDANRLVYRGILKVYEGFIVGRAASVWGDIAYSEAVNTEFTKPKLDEQAAVYAALQTLLDGAITDLGSGTGAGPGNVDLSHRGDAAKWIQTANTLKARYYIHWAEAQRAGGASLAMSQTACAGDCIAKAIAAANAGISTAGNDWKTVHTAAATEANVWYQFFNDRSGYIAAGAAGVDSLQNRGDARLAKLYSATSSGTFVGSRPGQNNGSASSFNIAPTTQQSIATCSETQLIKAEAYYYQGATAQAQSALAAGIACENARYSLSGASAIPVRTGLTGDALLAEIMFQKYYADFLTVEAYNNYKRTCYPRLGTFGGQQIPRRIFYGQTERISNNENIPSPSEQPRFNDNDPNGCAGVTAG